MYMYLNIIRVSFRAFCDFNGVIVGIGDRCTMAGDGGVSDGVIGVGKSTALGKQCCSSVIVRGGVLTLTSLIVIAFPKTEFSNTISLGGARVPKNHKR